MRPEDDALLAELLLRRGWLDAGRLRRAVEICEAARTLDLAQDLLQVLVQKGLLGERELHELEREVGLAHLAGPEHAEAIAGYRVWGELEPWGLGAVVRALQVSMERQVALKVLAPGPGREADLRERFLAEARAAAQVSHPNIVGALDMGRSGDYWFYATELVEGQSLREALPGGPMPAAQALRIAREMAEALKHIHGLGLTHRDVAPASILLGSDGAARLRNVGASRLPGDPSAARTGIPVGTPGYSAPELLGANPRCDIRSDVYSLGAVLYHALTGHRPGRADAGPVLPPAVVRPGVPPRVSDLVCRMTAAEPAERFQNPAELLRAIAEAEGAVGAVAAPGAVVASLPEIAPPAVAPAAGGELPAASQVPEAVPLPTIAAPPAPGRGGTGLRPVSLAWAVAFALAAAALVGASLWATVWRRGGRAARPPATAPAQPRDGRAGKQKPEPAKELKPTPPPPKPPEPPPVEPLPAIVEDALAFDKANPEGHAEALLRLRRALLAVGESAATTRLAARLALRQQALNSEANSAFGELSDQVAKLRAQGRFGPALACCAAFPASLRYGPWAELVAARLAEAGEEAERHYLGTLAKAMAALDGQKPDEAAAVLRGVGDMGIPWMARAVEPLAGAVAACVEADKARAKELAARRAVIERRKALGGLTRDFAAVHEEIKKRDYAKALELCRAVPAALREGERGKALAALERRMELLADLWETTLKGPPAAVGKPFALHGAEWVIDGFAGAGLNVQMLLRNRAGVTLRQPIWRLPGPQLGKLAEWAAQKSPPGAAALKLGLLYLTEGGEGAPAQARQKLQEAEKAGEDVAWCLEELDAGTLVTAALTAHRQGQWAEARKLLESALDRYATTSPVILSHRALWNALSDCLLKLGEPPDPQPAPLPPLPERAQWLVLLPETRLSPFPPANPLDAHLGAPALQRSGPQRLGLETWRDCALSLRWTAEPAAVLLLGARLAEPKPGVFIFYYVRVGDGQLALGRRDAAGDKVLAAKPFTARPGKQRLTFSLAGPDLTAEAEDGPSLAASDPGGLAAGRVLLAAPDASVAIEELGVKLLPPRPPAPKGK